MAKNKNNQAIWNTRIKKNASSLFQKVGNSIDIDKRLYKEDIQGSIAHVEMLFKQKIISFKIKNKIIYGLTKIEKEISNKKFEFNKKYEDIHMNIEKRLFQIIGEEAGYVHTARSRNDQVITDFKIWIRSSTKEINLNLDKVIKSTLKLAEKNIDTIMPGFTHLKNAQACAFLRCVKPGIMVSIFFSANFNVLLITLSKLRLISLVEDLIQILKSVIT